MKIVDIQMATCEEFNLKMSELLSRSRKRELAWPRHIAMGLAREMTKSTLNQIKKVFKRSDHTTVMHGVKRYKVLLEDSEWAHRIYNVEKRLKNV